MNEEKVEKRNKIIHHLKKKVAKLKKGFGDSDNSEEMEAINRTLWDGAAFDWTMINLMKW